MLFRSVDEALESQQQQLDDPKRLAELDEQRASLKRMQQNPPPDRETLERKATQKIAKLEDELNHHATWVYRYQLLKAKVIRHLPEDRFATVVWLLGAVVIGLGIKGIFEFIHERRREQH